MDSNKSPFVKWMFLAFGLITGVINAVLTAVFSYTYLPAAFGNPAGMLPQYAAALYGLLIMDVAYVAWFYVYIRMAESKGQRSLSIALAVISLGASIMATVTQLVTNSFGLVDLSAYTQTVGFIALGTMIVVTALHIVAFAAYILLEPGERVKSEAANIKADMLERALSEMKARVDIDASIVVDQFAAAMRRDVLKQLGFTERLSMIGSGDDEAIEGQHEVMPAAAASESPPLPTETRPRDEQPPTPVEQDDTEWHANRPPSIHEWVIDEAERRGVRQVDILKEIGNAILGNGEDNNRPT